MNIFITFAIIDTILILFLIRLRKLPLLRIYKSIKNLAALTFIGLIGFTLISIILVLSGVYTWFAYWNVAKYTLGFFGSSIALMVASNLRLQTLYD